MAAAAGGAPAKSAGPVQTARLSGGQEVKMDFGFEIPAEYARRAAEGIERCRKGKATVKVVDAAGEPVAGARVRARQTSHDFLFGCAFPSWDISKKEPNPQDWAKFEKHFVKLFNYATTENMLKWRYLERTEGSPDYTMADNFVAWCRKHGIRIKGHTLVWGTSNGGFPDWLQKYPPEEIARKTEKRVREMVARYKGKIDIWDVINEPLHLRWFEEKMGADYEVRALKWAQEANPDALLLVNEFGSQWGEADAFSKHASDLIARGAPIGAIGEQHHEPPRIATPQQVFAMLDKLGEARRDIHLTEIIMPSNGAQVESELMKGNWTPETQGRYYRYLYTLAFSHPRVRAITLWAMWDGSSWFDQGGIISKDWTLKPAYRELDSLINREWRTNASGRTSPTGEFGFRGFKGEYRIEVSEGGRTATGTLRIGDAEGGQVTVRLN